jgi:hypothetical protein
MQWLVFVIPAAQEVKNRRIKVQRSKFSLGKRLVRPYSTNKPVMVVRACCSRCEKGGDRRMEVWAKSETLSEK